MVTTETRPEKKPPVPPKKSPPAAPVLSPDDITTDIIKAITAQIDNGVELPTACDKVLAVVIADTSLQGAFVKEVGSWAIGQLWALRVRLDRKTPGEQSNSLRNRKVDPEHLKQDNAILESLVSIEDRVYIRLGAATKENCAHIEGRYIGLAQGNARKAEVFKELSEGLSDDNKVADVFTPDEVLGIFKKHEASRP